jgi:hypothetical protein
MLTLGLPRLVKVVAVVGGSAALAKVAPTFRAVDIVSTHDVPAPLQLPLQPTNVAPDDGAAVRVTLEFSVGFALQFVLPLPQSIPPPLTDPGPVIETLSAGAGTGPAEKVADTVFGPVMATEQVGVVPLQAPPQCEKVASEPAVAVNVTLEFSD